MTTSVNLVGPDIMNRSYVMSQAEKRCRPHIDQMTTVIFRLKSFLSKRLITIFIASINVTLNSLRMLAWLFNLLLQACFGGAALSKSSYTQVFKISRVKETKLFSTTDTLTRKTPNPTHSLPATHKTCHGN